MGGQLQPKFEPSAAQSSGVGQRVLRDFPPPGSRASSSDPREVQAPPQITPIIVKETTPGSNPVTRFTLTVQANPADGVRWTPIDVDRPTILYCLSPDNLATGPVIAYNYLNKPPSIRQSQISERGGTCYLSSPGRWWVLLLGLQPPGDAIDHVDMLAIDAWNPATAAKYMGQAGANVCFQFNTHLTSIAASVQIAPANRGRQAITLQNVPPAGSAGLPVRLSIAQPAGYLDALGVGIQLQVGSSITFSGDTLSRGAIRAIIDAGAAGAGTNIERLDYISFLDTMTGW
jgi:hypothetical protein